MLGNEVPIVNIIARNSRLPTEEGYVPMLVGYITIQLYICNIVSMYETLILCTHRQRVESLILSSQISTNLQRVYLGGDTIQLSFNIGMV